MLRHRKKALQCGFAIKENSPENINLRHSKSEKEGKSVWLISIIKAMVE